MTRPLPPRRLPDGRLEILRRYTGPGGEIGDGIDVIGPDHPAYPVWDEYLRERESTQEG